MSANNFNSQIISYLLNCPQIATNSLFFNAVVAKDNNKQLITVATNTSVHKKYIDGSILKSITFTIIDYRSVSTQPLVKQDGFPNENVEEMLDVQGIIDWIEEQNDLYNFPNLGEDYIVDEIHALTDIPNLNGVDTSVTPALAKYSISFRITYLDISKQIGR